MGRWSVNCVCVHAAFVAAGAIVAYNKEALRCQLGLAD